MPRNYTLKGKKVSWTQADLQCAVDEIRINNMTFTTAAEKFNIPRSILILKIKGWKNRPASGNEQNIHAKTVLGAKVEKQIVDSINALNKWGFSLSKSEILDLIQDYITKNGMETRFKNNRPGDDWWVGFKKRHKLSLKKPERLESSRARQASDPFIVMDFYNKLEEIWNELDLLDKPQCIWNADESGFNNDSGSTKIVCKKGEAAKRQIGGSGRQMTTILACGNAVGQVLPPTILHKGTLNCNLIS